MPIHLRFIVVLTIVCVALGTGGCRTTPDPGYEEMLLPLQTGSRIQRHLEVPVRPEKEKKSEKKKEEKKKAPKPEAEPSATPAPEEESTPPPADRFR
jgi:hypothetical protein